MSVPQGIIKLVQFFDDNKDEIRKNWNETQTRIELINPLFIELGWDVNNKQGRPDKFKDVIHEYTITVNGKSTRRAPDYSFNRVERLFFLEAKKPSVNIKTGSSPSYQLRSYSWSAKLPIGILTDFEELAIYNCQIRPLINDNAGVARIKYYQYKDYIEKWDEISSILSKNSVIKGSIEKFIEKTSQQKGTVDVDDIFLEEIERWRKLFATNIALRNNSLSQRELNFCVQKIIDRIIFLRICEDRGIENYGELLKLIEADNIYQELLKIFHLADNKYNSGLFYFSDEKNREDIPDKLTPSINIDDKILKDVIEHLYQPKSPYIFSVMPADILGSVYERFLGKIIVKKEDAKRATVIEKPEVKKAGGVYYTPSYIVKYIIKNTIGRLLNNKTPNDVAKIKVLDPSCGSGSFLIEAYQFLLDWHLKYYLENEPEKQKKGKFPKLFDCKAGTLLTIDEKKRILLNNIFGVDIDSQAVEVTKLSLLLKVLESEGIEITQKSLLSERVLPDLHKNIKCGNSLIGSDYYSTQEQSFFDNEEESLKINAFDWQKEFTDIINNGGFDIIIGNPPYVKEYTDRASFEFKNSSLRKYYQGKMDLWYAFSCHSIDLLKSNGYHSFIATSNWITNAGASILRNHILNNTKIVEYIDFGDFKVFETASIQTMVYVLQKKKISHSEFNFSKIISKEISEIDVRNYLNDKMKNEVILNFDTSISHKDLSNCTITFNDKNTNNILTKILNKKSYYLTEKEVANGIHPHYDFVNKPIAEKHKGKLKIGQGIFGLSDEEKKNLNLSQKENELIKPYFTTEQIKRYYINPINASWIIYTDSKFKNPKNINPYPNIKSHLDKFKNVITSDNKPYGLHRAREEYFFKGDKIISLRKCSGMPSFSFSDFDCYVSATFYIIKTEKVNQKYLLALLNSKLGAFWFKYKGKMQGNNYQIDKAPLLNFPIYIPNQNNQNEIIKSIDVILDLFKKLISLKEPNIIRNINNQISSIESKINDMIFDIYQLDNKEINFIKKCLIT